ncbi:MAG: hypothetical protein AAGO57_09410, partial [Pseudomonadota bacterium]
MARALGAQQGLTYNQFLITLFGGGAVLLFFAYQAVQSGAGADDDQEVAEVIEETVPDRAEAWGQRRFNPVANLDDEVTEESFFVEAPDVVELAWGWSQARAEPIPTVCIEYGVGTRTAQSSDIKITEVRDSYALSKAMNVSASVSVKGVGYQVSGKASFAKNSEVSSSSVTYLVNAEVLNSAQYVRPPETGPQLSGVDLNSSVGAVLLTEDARNLALRDIERFQATCGEGFVAATISGARAYLLAETKTSSSSERASVRASVQGSGWGVKVDAAAGLDTNSLTENLTRNLTFYQQGGGVTGDAETTQTSLPKDAEEAVQRITELPVAAAAAGKIFELQITPYQVLENFPRGEDLLAAEAEQDELAADWGAYATLYDDLKDVLENPAGYVMPIRRCGGAGDAATCLVEMVPLVENFRVNDQAIAMVEALQDMTLLAMNEIEIAADICLILEEACDYDGSLVRSPYSVRASMPILRDFDPGSSLIGTVDDVELYSNELTAVINLKEQRRTAEEVLAIARAKLPKDGSEPTGRQLRDVETAEGNLEATRAVLAAAEETLDAKLRTLAPHPEEHLIQHLREPALG